MSDKKYGPSLTCTVPLHLRGTVIQEPGGKYFMVPAESGGGGVIHSRNV
jgi:hypothetical protein